MQSGLVRFCYILHTFGGPRFKEVYVRFGFCVGSFSSPHISTDKLFLFVIFQDVLFSIVRDTVPQNLPHRIFLRQSEAISIYLIWFDLMTLRNVYFIIASRSYFSFFCHPQIHPSSQAVFQKSECGYVKHLSLCVACGWRVSSVITGSLTSSTASVDLRQV